MLRCKRRLGTVLSNRPIITLLCMVLHNFIPIPVIPLFGTLVSPRTRLLGLLPYSGVVWQPVVRGSALVSLVNV